MPSVNGSIANQNGDCLDTDSEDDSFDTNFLEYFERTQCLFSLGNSLNEKLTKVKQDLNQIEQNTTDLANNLNSLKPLAEKLHTSFCSRRARKKKPTKTNNPVPIPELIEDTLPADIPIDEPMSPSIIQPKTSKPQESPQISEEQACDQLFSMMEADNEIEETKEGPILNGQDLVFKSPKKILNQSLLPELENSAQKESKQRRSLPLSNCKISIKRLDLNRLDIKLGRDTNEYLKSSFNNLKSPQSKQDEEIDEEEREINNLCNYNIQTSSASKQTKEPKSTKTSRNRIRKEKKENSSSESEEEAGSVEEKDSAENKLKDDFEEKENELFNMIEEDNFDCNITDNESENSELESSLNRKKKKTKTSNAAESSNQQNKSKSIFEPSLLLRLSASEDEAELDDEKNNKSRRKNKSPKKVSKENSCARITDDIQEVDLDETIKNEEAQKESPIEEDEEEIGAKKKNKKETLEEENDESLIIGKKTRRTRSKRLISDSDIEEDVVEEKMKEDEDKESVVSSTEESNEDDLKTKKKKSNKLPMLKGIFASEASSDENKENEIAEINSDETHKDTTDSERSTRRKRSRVKVVTSESESLSDSSKKKKKRNKKIKKEYSEEDIRSQESEEIEGSESEDQDESKTNEDEEDESSPNKNTRHKLRNLIGDEKLTKETQDALQAERDRKRRIEEKRALENAAKESENVQDLFLDFDAGSKKPLVQVDPSIARVLKPHQIEGIKFMWDSCFEKVEMVKKGHKGSGCMLAHCMGLGKTLQVIAFVHTLLTNRDLTRIKKVLILVPVNVLTNWRKEFNHWTRDCQKRISIFELPIEKNKEKDVVRARLGELQRWQKQGGVFLIGYNIFARLVQGQSVKPKKLINDFQKCLLSPGADLVVCDEGHTLKSDQTNLNKSVSQIETSRRIVLTGTPLQNNLVEYHCMVSFVKPNLLGTLKEFKNRFVNPIYNGQHKDSTEADVRLMKKRAHILHNVLDGCVQRKDYSILRDLLTPKKEYVLSVRLSDKQIDLYRAYISHRGININNFGKMGGAQLFADFQELSRIWTHPWVLKLNEVRIIRMEERQAEANFIDDDDDEVLNESDGEKRSNQEEDDDILEITTKKPKPKRKTINGGGVNKGEDDEEVKKPAERWWTGMVSNECETDINLSGKLVILEQILKVCKIKGDKLLVFSQSLLSLDLIERFLEYITTSRQDCWKKDVDYFRMDGGTDLQKRKRHVENFNDPKNHRSRLFLISTKAGGIGINLVGANRCIIFDASWNPSYDTQSIFRIYRFGQRKNVFVYRFLAQGTMEEKIYQRQVTKQSLSQRVIDEHQLDRHFTSQELRELYAFEPDVWTGSSGIVHQIPDDDLLKSLLIDCKHWIYKYHEHDSLLENKLNEGLSEEERKAAWEEYEIEKQARTNNFQNSNFNAHLNGTFQEQFDFSSMGLPIFSGSNSLNSNPQKHLSETLAQRIALLSASREQEALTSQIQQMQQQQLAQYLQNQSQMARQTQQDNQIMNFQHQVPNITNIRVNENISLNQVLQRAKEYNLKKNNMNMRVPVSSNHMTQNEYLASILGSHRNKPPSSVQPTSNGLTLQQQHQKQLQNNPSTMPAPALLQHHRKQINGQTYSPQQPVSSSRSNTNATKPTTSNAANEDDLVPL